ncbi:MAG: Flp family type IVb pilin [Sphingomonadaceae bacterium]
MLKFLKQLTIAETGATAVEYSLILAFIFLAIAGALGTVGAANIESWGHIADVFTAANNT